jgi:hypothetical protein
VKIWNPWKKANAATNRAKSGSYDLTVLRSLQNQYSQPAGELPATAGAGCGTFFENVPALYILRQQQNVKLMKEILRIEN